jgi:hypothetical protein
MMGVYFRSSSVFLLIIVLAWHFSPSVFALFYSAEYKQTLLDPQIWVRCLHRGSNTGPHAFIEACKEVFFLFSAHKQVTMDGRCWARHAALSLLFMCAQVRWMTLYYLERETSTHVCSLSCVWSSSTPLVWYQYMRYLLSWCGSILCYTTDDDVTMNMI